jgi:AcrR family transcriptional regulator
MLDLPHQRGRRLHVPEAYTKFHSMGHKPVSAPVGEREIASPTASQRGRPRDPAVAQRIRKAALQEIADVGVDAFTMSRCARRARVSKASIYLRWPNAEALIIDVLASVSTWPAVPDLGDLVAELNILTAWFSSSEAWSITQLLMRFAGQSARHPDLFQAHQHGSVVVGVKRVSKVFQRAQQRGEVAPDLDPGLLAIAFIGALSIALQLSQTPGHKLPKESQAVATGFVELLQRTAEGVDTHR